RFLPARSADGGQALVCPSCQEPVPLRYGRDCARFPPVVCSLLGHPGHGKTTYLASLLHEFEHLGIDEPEFSYLTLDEAGLRAVRQRQRAAAEGRPAAATPKARPTPVLVRLGRTPALGPCHLLLYDLAGAVCHNAGELKEWAGHLCRCPVLVWLVSLREA